MEVLHIRIYPCTGYTSYGPRSIAVKASLYFKEMLLRAYGEGWKDPYWQKRFGKNIM